MSRKPVVRDLPTLRSIHPRFRGFAATETKSHALVKKLRETIEQVRQDAPISFYAMREVGAFFDVALKTVVEAYETLEGEGLLTRIRGAQTMVQGRRLQPRHPVRGVVGIPVYLPAFVIGTAWRALLIRLEEELRHHHFVADLIFYRSDEQFGLDFTERLIEHQLDTVFWFAPVAANLPAMRLLLDGGIRLVVVSDGKALFPRQQYFLNIERALAEGIASWQTEGVTSFTILQSATRRLRHEFGVVKSIFDQQGLAHAERAIRDDELPAITDEFARKKGAGVIFLHHRWYESLCNMYPRDMEKLFHGTRVLLVQGPVYHPWFQGKTVLADTTRLPFEQIASRVARDISSGRADARERLDVFHTQWQPRLNLGAVSREI